MPRKVLPISQMWLTQQSYWLHLKRLTSPEQIRIIFLLPHNAINIREKENEIKFCCWAFSVFINMLHFYRYKCLYVFVPTIFFKSIFYTMFHEKLLKKKVFLYTQIYYNKYFRNSRIWNIFSFSNILIWVFLLKYDTVLRWLCKYFYFF